MANDGAAVGNFNFRIYILSFDYEWLWLLQIYSLILISWKRFNIGLKAHIVKNAYCEMKMSVYLLYSEVIGTEHIFSIL